MILAYLYVCLPLLGQDFCFQEKALSPRFSTDDACWAAVDDFMDRTKAGPTTVVYHFRCGGDT